MLNRKHHQLEVTVSARFPAKLGVAPDCRTEGPGRGEVRGFRTCRTGQNPVLGKNGEIELLVCLKSASAKINDVDERQSKSLELGECSQLKQEFLFYSLQLEVICEKLMILNHRSSQCKVSSKCLYKCRSFHPPLFHIKRCCFGAQSNSCYCSFMFTFSCWVSFKNQIIWTFVAPVLVICVVRCPFRPRTINLNKKATSAKIVSSPLFSERFFPEC